MDGDETATAGASSPRVGVVTVAFESDEVLPGFLASLTEASSAELAVVVVDNAPDLGHASELALQAGAAYLPLAGNPGYGGGMNAGVRALPGDIKWIVVANPDVVLGPETIDRLIAKGEADDRVGTVGPRVLDPSGATYPSARRIPSLRTGIGHALLANIWTDNPWTRSYRDEASDADVPRDAGWLSGSCVVVRRSAFDELGGFDEGYFMYFEDVDLGFRMSRAGWLNRYSPDAVVLHSGAHATRSRPTAMLAAHHDSARRFLGVKYPGPLLAPVRLALRIGLRARLAALKRNSIRD